MDNFETCHGTVTIKPRNFNWSVNAFVIELKLTPPNMSGWAVTATLPEEMEGKVTQALAERWAGDAINKLM